MPVSVSYSQARDQVARLVERFGHNLDAYKRADYKETQVRVEFIDPFFEALGWDVRNVQGYAERDLYRRQVESTDRQIDALMYDLYGLTDEEIRLVEGDQ
jgi:hypothetical protein